MSIDLDFDAGQYVELRIPGSPLRRAYSIASPPSQESSIELHIRLTPGGLATEGWVFASLAVGERVTMQGPLGTFSMIEPEDGPVVLVAGGTGIAPLKAILLHAVEQGLASVRALLEEFEELSAKFSEPMDDDEMNALLEKQLVVHL